MGKTKRDLLKRKSTLKARLEKLEVEARKDPLKKNFKLHQELEEVKKQLAAEE
jgi:hypothetical protein